MMAVSLLFILPIIVVVIGLVIFAAVKGFGSPKSEQAEYTGPEQPEEKTCMIEGMCIGLAIGAALSVIGFVNIGLGTSMGMMFGLAAGALIKK